MYDDFYFLFIPKVSVVVDTSVQQSSSKDSKSASPAVQSMTQNPHSFPNGTKIVTADLTFDHGNYYLHMSLY